jgi:hypothetical protein
VDSLKTWKVRGAQFQRELRLRFPGSHYFRLAMAEIRFTRALLAAGVQRDARDTGARRVRRLEQGINAHIAGETFGWSLCGRL